MEAIAQSVGVGEKTESISLFENLKNMNGLELISKILEYPEADHPIEIELMNRACPDWENKINTEENNG